MIVMAITKLADTFEKLAARLVDEKIEEDDKDKRFGDNWDIDILEEAIDCTYEVIEQKIRSFFWPFCESGRDKSVVRNIKASKVGAPTFQRWGEGRPNWGQLYEIKQACVEFAALFYPAAFDWKQVKLGPKYRVVFHAILRRMEASRK